MTDFFRHCVCCAALVPEDRLRRGADTCSPACKQADRRAQRKAQKQWNLERLVRMPKARKMVRQYEQDKKSQTSNPAVETPQLALRGCGEENGPVDIEAGAISGSGPDTPGEL